MASIAAVCQALHIMVVRQCFSGSGQANRSVLCLGFSSLVPPIDYKRTTLVLTPRERRCTTHAICQATKSREELLVVVGGGAAGVYGAIHAKTVAPHLGVVVIEKGKPLSKVKVSGGGRCNVTNGHCVDNMILAENYPRGHKELRGSFFNMHGPVDTMSWFASHGVELKVEDDGRVFPVSNSSSSIIDCLMSEVKQRGVSLQTRKIVTAASILSSGKFLLEVQQQSSDHGYTLASQLGHSIVDPVPSLFTFKIEDLRLRELSGVTFPKVKVKLKLDSVQRNIPQLTQVGPMLVTHWGLSGPVILRLSAWGARFLFSSGYKGRLFVDFIPDLHVESLKLILSYHKQQYAKQKVLNSCPPEFGISKRFWSYVLEQQGLSGDILWASIPNSSLMSIGSLLKDCIFEVTGKGQFKDEFVTAGGVPLSEISLNTMESKICSRLFFAGEILNVDGVTGGFNFQNAWSGGFIAGTTIGGLALGSYPS
ncbi:YtfP protein [Spatholobus suberectus]|nr:YtfP protein [Spatholobus suberectus]